MKAKKLPLLLATLFLISCGNQNIDNKKDNEQADVNPSNEDDQKDKDKDNPGQQKETRTLEVTTQGQTRFRELEALDLSEFEFGVKDGNNITPIDRGDLTMDISSFKGLKGSYDIEVCVTDNPKIKTTITVNVVAITKIELKEGASYFNKIQKNEHIAWYDTGLTIVETYSDGVKEEVSEPSELSSIFRSNREFVNSNSVGEVVVRICPSINSALEIEIKYQVIEATNIVDIKLLEDEEVSYTYAYADRTSASVGDISVGAKYSELGDRYVVNDRSLTVDMTEVFNAPSEGTYNAYFRKEGNNTVKLAIKFKLVSLNEYTFKKFEIAENSSHIIDFLVGEEGNEVKSSIVSSLTVNAIYSKFGYQDVAVNYDLSRGQRSVTCDFSKAGETTVEVSLANESISGKVTYKATVHEIDFGDGEYVYCYDSVGILIANKWFKKENGKIYLYSRSQGAYETDEAQISRYMHMNNVVTIALQSEKNSTTIAFNDYDGSLTSDYACLGRNGVYTIGFTVAGENVEMLTTDGKLNAAAYAALQMYGTPYLDEEGTIPLTPDYVFDKNTNIYLLFGQMDATGQAFLGKYVLSDGSNGPGSIEIKDGADGKAAVFIYSSSDFTGEPMLSCKYLYQLGKTNAMLILETGFEISVSGDELTLYIEGSDYTYTREGATQN